MNRFSPTHGPFVDWCRKRRIGIWLFLSLIPVGFLGFMLPGTILARTNAENELYHSAQRIAEYFFYLFLVLVVLWILYMIARIATGKIYREKLNRDQNF